MKESKQNGFTLVELLCIISFVCMAIPVTWPIFSGGKVKEAQAKAKLHTIQIAVERYYVDHHEYPPYLLGGDSDGWLYWHHQWDETDPDPDKPANAWVDDPLIKYSYMACYPENSFIDVGDGSLIIDATSFITDPGDGDGDPRFGYRGNIMGMGLDDPNYFEDAHPNLPYSRIETKRTLDRGGAFDPTKCGFPSRDLTFVTMSGLYYNFGGRHNPYTGKPVVTFWPGNFFYRGVPEILPMRGGYSWPWPNACSGGIVNSYFMGVWGSSGSEGEDVIRLQQLTPDENQNQIYWRFPPPWPSGMGHRCGYSGSMGQPSGLPAVLGGGDAETGPFWPPDRDPEHYGEIIFGAPDGVKDGIVLTLRGPQF